MFPPLPSPPSAPLEPLHLPWLKQAGVEVAVLRLDLIDPLISGNKWFKLTHHLAAAAEAGAEGVISLGGAHSNHLHALAAAGKRFGFPTVGLLRGHAQDTPTSLDLQAFGMQLHWLVTPVIGLGIRRISGCHGKHFTRTCTRYRKAVVDCPVLWAVPIWWFKRAAN